MLIWRSLDSFCLLSDKCFFVAMLYHCISVIRITKVASSHWSMYSIAFLIKSILRYASFFSDGHCYNHHCSVCSFQPCLWSCLISSCSSLLIYSAISSSAKVSERGIFCAWFNRFFITSFIFIIRLLWCHNLSPQFL